jgi:hypothetical protein
MELRRSNVDNAWIDSALHCYWSSAEDGVPYIPCPDDLRPHRSIFDDEMAWYIYLPSLAGGYVMDISLIDARKRNSGWPPLIFGGVWIVWLGAVPWLLSSSASGGAKALVLLGLIALFLILPALAYLPWEMKVRRECTFVSLSPELLQAFEQRIQDIGQRQAKFRTASTLAGGVAGAVAGIFLGKVGEKVAELVVESAVSDAIKGKLAQAASDAIREAPSSTDSEASAGGSADVRGP